MSISLAVSSPGAIPNLDALKSTIADWLDRGDIDDRIPVFIQMSESLFNRDLRTPQMEASITFSAVAENTNLPDDFLAMRSMYLEGSPDRPLSSMSPTAIRQSFNGASGIPVAYSLVSEQIRLVPPPDGEILLTMDYWARIEPLSVFSPSNWLLNLYPNAYLYASLYHAEAMLDNPDKASIWKSLTDEFIDKIGSQARLDRYGAAPLAPNTAVSIRGIKA